MRIGIIGAGMIGGSLAALFGERGHEVLLSNSRGPHTLQGQVAALPAAVRAETVEDAARGGDVVVVAIPLYRFTDLPAEAFAGKIVVDAGNYYPSRDGVLPQLESGQTTSSEMVAGHLAGARLVKAFNTIYFQNLRDDGRPDAPDEDRVAIPVAGDDAKAKGVVAELIREIGFAPVDAGSLAEGRRQEPGTPVYGQVVGPAEARDLLARAD
ncbi:MAG TPA: NAD(P)-binding domain-containing protein [Micromonosporaceae bacterium]|nr:NAD(P)-binding domain-containing protein [Micromonosporaceae bacterium]